MKRRPTSPRPEIFLKGQAFPIYFCEISDFALSEEVIRIEF